MNPEEAQTISLRRSDQAIQQPMPSTVIRHFSYSPEAGRLLVVFQSGRRYQYENVPLKVYDAMTRARSRGAYFNLHVRNQFPYSEIGA